MKKLSLFIFASAALAACAIADDQIQAVQQYLKEQGFYYGQVDGAGGSETGAAIRRFQIRNGLEVTGQLNPQTLAAMNLGGDQAPSVPARQPSTPPPPVPQNNDRDYLNDRPVPPSAASTPAYRTGGGDYADIFRRTPYEKAPAEVQISTLRSAQIKLARNGYYRGPVDGNPGDSLSQAIAHYQADEALPRTGRLDLDTLASMNLLPRGRVVHPSFDRDRDYGSGRPVYQGIWVH